jgi:hypothetical protein
MKKNIAFAVLVLLLAAAAFAQTEADFTVELTEDNTGIRITAYNGNATTVRIPATIQGMPVHEVAGFYKNKTLITSVVVPEGVTSLGGFGNSLTSINFPTTLTYIFGFGGTKLTAVDLSGTSITKIAKGTFRNCTSLKSVVLPPSIGDLTLAAEGTYSKPSHSFAGISHGVMESAFENCTALTTVTIPEGVEEFEIGQGAFKNCTALTTFNIPETVENIYIKAFGNDSAFSNCPKLPIATQAKLKGFGYTGRF